MSFLHPLGLLGLIGVPILILIYIIKSKYSEQTIASTFLWTLSEKFLKRKNPISPLAGIISLILQILAVVTISLIVAKPIFTIPNSANEYCFVLDASGSMNMKNGNETYFKAAKDEINRVINSSVDGSVYTLIYAGDTTRVVFEKTDDKQQAKTLLEELEVSHMATDFTDAIGLAQGYFNESPATLTYFVTDTAYTDVKNIEVINVAKPVENYGLTDVYYISEGSTLTITGKANSYHQDADLTLELYMDDAQEAVDTLTVSVKKGEPTVFTFTRKADSFSSLKVKIQQTDALPLDNEYVIYDVKSEDSYKTLLVSERPFFMESVLKSISNAPVEVLAPEDYTGQTGYGLYIFDTIDSTGLAELPKDGTVWLMNIAGSVTDSGFTVQGEMTFAGSEVLTPSTSSSSTTQALMDGLLGNDIHIKRYIKCGFYRNFTTVFSYQGNPVVFAGTNSHGGREVVFAFDLHDSNLPLLYDFSILMRNLVDYSFPNMVETTTYTCGDVAEINVIANCQSIRVESPLGNISYLDIDSATAMLPLTEAGNYHITMTVAGSTREFNLFSALAEEERIPENTEAELMLQGEKVTDGFDGTYDPIVVLFILLALFITADWMVYCYEKYQLR